MLKLLDCQPNTTEDSAIKQIAKKPIRQYHAARENRLLQEPDERHIGLELECMYEDVTKQSTVPEYYFKKHEIQFDKELDATCDVEYITLPIPCTPSNIQNLANCINNILTYNGNEPSVFMNRKTALHLNLSSNNLIDIMGSSTGTQSRIDDIIRQIAEEVDLIGAFGREFNSYACRSGSFFSTRNYWMSLRPRTRVEFRLMTFQSKKQLLAGIETANKILDIITEYAAQVLHNLITPQYHAIESSQEIKKNIKQFLKEKRRAYGLR